MINVQTSRESNTTILNTFLIGQIGKADGIQSSILNLEILLGFIFVKIKEVQNIIGGTNVLVEVDKNPKLIELYKKHGFEYLQDDESELSQLLQISLYC